MAGAKVFVLNIMSCFNVISVADETCVTFALRQKATKQAKGAMTRAKLYYYLFALQGYLKVTVMVLGPGDEAPVS